MAKGEKRVSVKAVDSVMKNMTDAVMTYDWNGIEVRIKKNISFVEMLEFVNDVVSSCVQTGDDGGQEYMPELLNFAIRSNVATKYANFSMPDNLEHRYEFLYNTDMIEFIKGHIDMSQLETIEYGIKAKIKYLNKLRISEARQELDRLITMMSGLADQTDSFMNGMDPEDMSQFVKAVANGKMDEEKLVKAYMEASHEGKPELVVLDGEDEH